MDPVVHDLTLPTLASAQAPPGEPGGTTAEGPTAEATTPASEGDTRLIIRVHGVTSSQGRVYAALFTEGRGFPVLEYKAAIVDVEASEGTVELVFTGLEPGQVAAIVYHDVDGDDDNPCVDLLLETVSTASVIGPPAGPVPDAGAPFVIAETGVEYVRISDVDDAGAIGSFYTNGYSRWSPASVTGEYVTAFSSDGRASIYRLVDRTIVATLAVGEPDELHWDRSGEAGTQTHLYYRQGASLRRVDVLTGDDVEVHDFTAEYPGAGEVLNGVEGAPSNDMRYWALQVCDGMTGGGQCTGLRDVIVYDRVDDIIVGRLGDVQDDLPTPNFVDMSPSGSVIVVGTCKDSGSTPEPWDGPYAWSRDFSTRVRLGTNCTHSGWAWGSAGEEYYVSFDSCGAANEEITFSCDYYMAVDVHDPQGWDNRLPVLYAGDVGWGIGTHVGRVYEASVPGWFLISTYGGSAGDWAAEQLFFVELADESEGPRLWRIGPTANTYGDYWSEAFASLDHGAAHIYWGANWSDSDNLELYRATLCDDWWLYL